MSEDVYKRVTKRSNNVVKVMNFVLKLKEQFGTNSPLLRKWREETGKTAEEPEVRRTPGGVWSLLISCDQQIHPIKDRKEVQIVNGFTVVALRLERLTLPVLSREGPLLEKIIATHHREQNGPGRLGNMHVPASVIRSKLFNSRYGVYCFKDDEQIKKRALREP